MWSVGIESLHYYLLGPEEEPLLHTSPLAGPNPPYPETLPVATQFIRDSITLVCAYYKESPQAKLTDIW